MIDQIIDRSLAGAILSPDEIKTLFRVPLFSLESTRMINAARRMSDQACGFRAEVHAQVGLNIAPCPRNCLFCSFAAANKIFPERYELSAGEAVSKAKGFERDGANAVYLMATANYPFERFLETASEVKKSLEPETVLVANVDDFSLEQARSLKDAGFVGVYHALRLGEGRETAIPPDRRLATFRNAREAGLLLGTCLEPVGPEHTLEELVEKTLITREAGPVFSGAARRIVLPGSPLSSHGQVSEARMAHILAVVRLALGAGIPGNCTHEPSIIGAFAGANLLWAEAGSNPRDTEQETEGKHGMTVEDCRTVFKEAEWEVLSGPSRFFGKGDPHPGLLQRDGEELPIMVESASWGTRKANH